MPESRQATDEVDADDRTQLRGIHAIRRSLGLGDAEARLVRDSGDRLSPLVDGWVDNFYVRLLKDPIAHDLLRDEGRVVRLKRSLSAWLHEIFSLPFDEVYERARTAIGQAHVRIGMPPHLMVTAMGALRRDVRRTILEQTRIERRESLAHAMELVLDMELALMLDAYRRQERRVVREKDRAVYAERAVRLLASAQRDRVDAALCYAELALSSDQPRRKHLVELRDLLQKLGRAGVPLGSGGSLDMSPIKATSLGVICRVALDNVSLDVHTQVALRVQPPDAPLALRDEAVRLAVEELIQNAATHGIGGEIQVEARSDLQLGVVAIEVRDSGAGWNESVRHLRDVYAQSRGLGLSYCELVAELHDGSLEIFQAPGGGAGVRLQLQTARPGTGTPESV